MKEFVEYLLKAIVTKPEELTVEETREGTVVNIKICAAEEDMGIVIGKGGKTIRSIRALAKCKAIKESVKVYVETC
jgi:predicted RNA-binding protein YlqC (UPF0109 family)